MQPVLPLVLIYGMMIGRTLLLSTCPCRHPRCNVGSLIPRVECCARTLATPGRRRVSTPGNHMLEQQDYEMWDCALPSAAGGSSASQDDRTICCGSSRVFYEHRHFVLAAGRTLFGRLERRSTYRFFSRAFLFCWERGAPGALYPGPYLAPSRCG